MEKLIQHNLRFGKLFRVELAHLVERYNDALEEICGRRTELMAFDIDAIGYSPQIAEEFGNEDYLDQHGINPNYIIISTRQRFLPVIRNWFTAYEDLLEAFWEANHEALFTLTTLTSVYGMIQNNTYRVNAPEDLLSINTVRFVVETPDNLIDTAVALEENIEKFHGNPDAWLDDSLVEEMCAQARLVGDIRRQPLVPAKLVFEKGSYFTEHYGGLFIMRLDGGYTVISLEDTFDPPRKVNSSPVEHLQLSDQDTVIKMLRDRKLIDQVGASHTRDRTTDQELAFLRGRRDLMTLIHMSEQPGRDPDQAIDEDDMRRHLVEYIDEMPEVVSSLVFAIKQLEAGRRFWAWDVPKEHRSYFLRASHGEFAELVNQMLSHYCDLDPLFMFATNKPLFYRLYADWPEGKKLAVVSYIKEHWLDNRERTARILFDQPSG